MLKNLRYIKHLNFFAFKAKRFFVRALIEKIFGKYSLPIGADYDVYKASIYDETRSKVGFWEKEHQSVNNTLKDMKDIQNVLDAPFGTGRFLKLYKKHNLDVVGIDISAEMIEIANKKYPKLMKNVVTHVDGLIKISYKDSYFDLICCYRFLSWIINFQDAQKIVVELNRVCRKYALLEFCVGKHLTSSKKIKPYLTMWNRMNEKELTLWLRECGFEVIKTFALWDDDENPGLTAFLCKKL